MLKVAARAKSSPLHGLGLFAEQDIPCGQIIWEFHPGFDVLIPEHVFREFPESIQTYVRYFATYHESMKLYLLSSDDDRYTNHSADPNTVSTDPYFVRARRDIRAGSEITADYHEIGMLFIP